MHEKRGTAIIQSSSYNYIASVGADGALAISTPGFSTESESYSVVTHDPFAGGIASACTGEYGKYIFTVGRDGLVCGFSLDRSSSSEIRVPVVSTAVHVVRWAGL